MKTKIEVLRELVLSKGKINENEFIEKHNNMKQTAAEKLGIAFREWQREWDSFEERGKDKPVSYDEFIKPFLEMEKQQIIDACNQEKCFGSFGFKGYEDITKGEQYYNETFKNK